MKTYWLGCFANMDDLCRNFNIDEKTDLEGADVLLASYDIDGYEGTAFVLYQQNGKLYEVNASHCSCYGLEEGWNPEETSVEAIRFRMEQGTLGYNSDVFRAELGEVLDALEVTHVSVKLGARMRNFKR
jgi:hypothetical protein